jgi:TolB-like protein/Tfp pilus assembly protein PilF
VNPTKFLTELKRRNVYRAAVAYGVVAWFLTQLTTQVFPFFEIPNSAVRFVVVTLAVGFPIAMLLAWLYEFTPEGIVRTEDLDPAQARSVERFTGRILDFIIIGVLLLAIAMLIVGRRPFYRQTGESVSQKSIAVLPFENLSRDPDNAYFATGIQDEILTRIAKIGALKVISRVSTRQYSARPDNLSEIAHQLGVANILEGSVQRAADQVHVNVQLISAATDEHLWAESYDRKLENIFGVEAEVAAAVAEALKAKLTGAEQHALEQKPTNNPEAYDAYLRGIAVYGEATTLDEFSKSIPPFEEAVRLDPNFALAWAMLARLNSQWYFWLEMKPSRRAAAQTSLDTALRLRPDLPEVQLAQAFYQYWVLDDPEGARPSFERLLTKLPNDADIPFALMFITLMQGRWDESRAYVDKGIELNPRDRGLRESAALIRVGTRDFAAALRCFDEALSIWPDDAYLIAEKAYVYQSLGKLDQADALLQKLHPTVKNDVGLDRICYQAKLRRSHSDTIQLLRNWLAQGGSFVFMRNYYRLLLGDLERLSGDIAHANASYAQARDDMSKQLKEELDDGSISDGLAEAYAGLGDSQLAMKYIERAISLKPASKDAWFGPRHEFECAKIAARFGQKDLAISILAHLLTISYRNPVTPALLRLDPDFDPLRSDPRFQKLVSESEPK